MLKRSRAHTSILMRPWLPPALILAGVVLLWIGRTSDRSVTAQTGQHAYEFRSGDEKIRYLLFLPEDYSHCGKKWPLILYLHGASLRGSAIDKVKRYGLPKKVEKEGDFPFIVLSPQCPANKSWREVNGLQNLLDEVIAQYAVDSRRVYLTGVSLGGTETWRLAATYPERFAAIAPVCGYGDPQTGFRLTGLPAWVFHGAQDRVVPLSISEEMVKAIRKGGGKVKFTVFPEAGHSIVEEVYYQPELYEWFLAHRK